MVRRSVAEYADQLADGMVLFGELYAAAYEIRTQTCKLQYFSPHEFGLWWPFMDTELLLGLDRFRDLLGAAVVISPAPDAIGRMSNKASQHYPAPVVRAIDIMPAVTDLAHAYRVARKVGFHGIGVYPDWRPRPGLHLDMRTDRTPADPALWSARKVNGEQVYGAIGDVIRDWQQWDR